MEKSGKVLLSREDMDELGERPLCPFAAWSWLVMEANWEDKTDAFGEVVKRGELHTSQPALARAWGWSRSRVNRFLERLESGQRIGQQANSKRTKIRITDYEESQQLKAKRGQRIGQQADREPDSERDTTEHHNTKHISLLLIARETVVNEFGEECFNHYLPRLADYLASSGKKYKDYSAFFRNCVRRDRDAQKGFFFKNTASAPRDFMERRAAREETAVEKAKALRAAQDAIMNPQPKQPRLGRD